MLKIIVGLLIACALTVATASANAAVATRKAAAKVVQKSKPFIAKTFEATKRFLWKNKEGIAVGATVTAVAMQSETVASGVNSVFSPIVSGILLYLLIAGGIIVVGRYLLRCLGRWGILPLLLLGLLLCCGVAEAGVFDTFAGPEVQCAVLPGKTLWDIAMVAIVILSIFM